MTALSTTVPVSGPRSASRAGSLSGLGVLLRLALRRDKVMLPVWVYAAIGSVAATAVSFRKLYPSTAAREQFAASINTSSSLRALYGPVHDGSSIGGLTAWRMGAFGGVVVALMSFLLVVRHSRAEEEAGRLELVGAGAVGRRAPLTAAVGTAVLGNVLVAVLIPVILIALGERASGSIAFGVSLGAAGLVFTGTAAVAAQLAETGRAANGLCGALLGLAFVVRAAGDAAGSNGPGWLVWLSPLGWTEQVRAYGGDRWWVVALALGCAAGLTAAAYVLVGRRDLGAGLLPQRPGPAVGAAWLRSPAALAWRLQRGSLIGWSLGFLIAGAVFGSLANGVLSLLQGNAQLEQIIRRMGGQQVLVDSYLATMTNLLGMVAAVYAVQAVLRLRGEETGGRAEPLLATAVSRLRWAGSHLAYPLAGSALLLLAGGLGTGVAAGAVLGDVGGRTTDLLGGALVQLPAVWFMAATAVAVVGLLPSRTSAAWGVLGGLLLIAYLGPVVHAGQWLLDLSPFTHVPRLPGSAFTVEPLLWLTVLAAALAAAGLAGLRRRDLG
ncbi:ABC-2 type transport system permease protein [Streptacidiphilus sp. MAP12-16]|uniref:ABC transporter permease n=1 Tax=Streptacidiphilus sp. MAP12-16 TaxID=3156300 RepID=UPI0035115585